ncbi:MAG: peptide deformylase [Terriglobia bacterium]
MRTVIKYPDPTLATAAPEVVDFDDKLKDLAADMIETMKSAKGVGLAAIQVGEPVRMFVALNDAGEPVVFVNPDWVPAAGHDMARMSEGCLSVPGVFEEVDRYTGVVCVAKNLKGENFTVEATGRFAQCIQHESEHLNGDIFVNRLSATKRNRIRKLLERRARILAFDASRVG